MQIFFQRLPTKIPATNLEHWLNTENVASYLGSVCFEFEPGNATIRRLTGHHICFHATDNRYAYFVKQYDELRPFLSALAVERHLGDVMPSMFSRMLHADEQRRIVISTWIEGITFDQALATAERVARDTYIGLLIEVLQVAWQNLDSLRRRMSLATEPHWVTSLLTPTVDTLRYLSPAQLDVIRTIQSSPVLSDGLNSVARLWFLEVVLHGDVRAANILAHQGNLTVVDWESTQLGPKAWDLACVIAIGLLQWLLSQDTMEVLDPNAKPGHRVFSAVDIKSFVRQAEPLVSSQDLLTPMLAGALIKSAFEGASGSRDQSIVVALLLQMASNVLQHGINYYVE